MKAKDKFIWLKKALKKDSESVTSKVKKHNGMLVATDGYVMHVTPIGYMTTSEMEVYSKEKNVEFCAPDETYPIEVLRNIPDGEPVFAIDVDASKLMAAISGADKMGYNRKPTVRLQFYGEYKPFSVQSSDAYALVMPLHLVDNEAKFFYAPTKETNE